MATYVTGCHVVNKRHGKSEPVSIFNVKLRLTVVPSNTCLTFAEVLSIHNVYAIIALPKSFETKAWIRQKELTYSQLFKEPNSVVHEKRGLLINLCLENLIPVCICEA